MQGQLVIQCTIFIEIGLNAKCLAAQRLDADPPAGFQFSLTPFKVIEKLSANKTFYWWEIGNKL
jgi:hypothetical protein